LFALSLSRTSSAGFGPQLRRGRCPGSCARANWIDSGDRGDQAHFEKGETSDRSVLDLPFLGNGIQNVSDQEKSLVSSLQWGVENKGIGGLS